MLFGIIGVGGFVAPKHIKAIYETGHVLDCAVDIHDSVGVLDQYYLDCEFFTSLEDLHQYLQECKADEKFLDFMVICTPNYLHFEHIEFALSHGINVICEKPLVLDPGELNEIRNLEKKYDRRVFNIMQLRLHPNVIDLKKSVQAALLDEPDKIYNISLTYLILRGKWYFNSWKGDEERSGGLALNLCIHFFDILLDIFGAVVDFAVHVHKHDCIGGTLRLEHAHVLWFLSINPAKLGLHRNGSYRSLVLEGQEIDFSHGMEDLCTKSYQEILSGEGLGLEDVRPSLELASDIRHANLTHTDEECHPLCHKVACHHHD
ncbi:Gfo/Idh/MocA family protein [Helicobacter heilmannii]|uniref:Lipopolysaccharide biosynthesis protein wbpB n=1 Tax=Helicobacter heilmannii TaxID=35817 RepID=A0A0K2YE16_HELHE|nr:Gfo/Idh/MocA family oxidoreductase [Helicobacter heilmannii]BDQ27945.1 oxidoreductase [Helicobacter heilmannii]CCM10758.1 lipopolysaccharide biosynthesis protein wbpB [Helicobacter heilmannii ASB1.4]CRI35205.1 lipopolysaccharide biosynthesis protein wbpB [Helicobacter heilmannii]